MKGEGFESENSGFGGQNRVELDDKFWSEFGGVGGGCGIDTVWRLLH